MSTFVPNYDHDIFVSYAHVDNEPDPGFDDGWITILIRALKNRLGQKLGRADSYSLWMDHLLSRNVSITPEILKALRSSASLLIILSPGYLASEWCHREKNAFLSTVETKVRSGSRIFLVEMDKVDESQRPLEFGDLLGYRFWVADREGKPPRTLGMPSRDESYYDKLNELCNDLVKELCRLKCTTERVCMDGAPTDARPTVFLAEGTDDLDPLNDDMRRYLDQAGCRVLPTMLYPREANAFRQAIAKDIRECTCFIQLLSEVSGKKPSNSTGSYVQLQYECAKDEKKPILQWRSPDLVLNTVRNSDHRALLELDTVMAIGIEEFKGEVVREAQLKPAARQKSKNALVFVDAEAGDWVHAEAICNTLNRCGVGYALPLKSGKPGDVREYFKQNVLNCEASIIVYGSAPSVWVRSQLLEWRKLASEREDEPHFLAVYEGPPSDSKDPLNLMLPGMRTINCRNGLHEEQLKAFLDYVKTE